MAKKTAIPKKDATTVTDKPAKKADGPAVAAPTPEKNPRNIEMEALADRLEKAMIEDDPNLAEQLAEQTKPAEPETEKPKEEVVGEKIDDAPRMVRVKIDGEEKDLSEADVIKGFQKDATASKRLEEAARKQKELDARETALTERERQIVAAQQAVKDSPTPPAPEGDAVKEFLTAFYEGDEEKTEQALRRLTAGRPPATHEPDLSSIVPAVKDQVKKELEAEKAVTEFTKDYKDIIDDPYLAKVADAFFDAEIKDGKSFSEALKTAGNNTRDWIKKYTPEPAPSARQERLSRKESIDNLPVTSAVSGAVNKDEPETPSSIIAKMREARGLPA